MVPIVKIAKLRIGIFSRWFQNIFSLKSMVILDVILSKACHFMVTLFKGFRFSRTSEMELS